jgi:hypothetical protein
VPVSDAASGQVVRGKFQRNPVTIHDLNAVAPKPSRHGGEHGFPDIELDGKHAGLKLLDYLPHYFDCVFFWQIVPFPVKLVTVSPAAAAAAITTATTTGSLGLGTSFVDVQRSAVQVFTIQTVDCRDPFGIDAHFDEGEATGLTGITVRHNVHAVDSAVRLEHRTNGIFGCPEAKVTHENIFQITLLSELAEQLIGECPVAIL